MTWLEIVNVRTAGKTEFVEAFSYCCRIRQDLESERSVSMNLYRSISCDTDFTIHLCWDSTAVYPAKSDIGIRLSKSLIRFGLTDHQVWQSLH